MPNEYGKGVYWSLSGSGDGSGIGWGVENCRGYADASENTRIKLERNVIFKAHNQKELPLIQIDSLEFDESKLVFEELLKEI